MREMDIQYLVWVLFGVVGIIITFYVFGAELPLYLILALPGLILYIYSENPTLKFAGGLVGRFFATLFVISLLYYFGTRTFFPSDQFDFRFLKLGVKLAIDSFNWTSNLIGQLILKLIDIIIP